MIEHIFDSANSSNCSSRETTVYQFDQSPRIHLIRKIIQQRQMEKRHEKLKSAGTPKPMKQQMFAEQVPSSLPSPPVESPDFIMHDTLSVSSLPDTQPLCKDETQRQLTVACDATSYMTDSDIQRRLEELKEEKHRLFQWIKRLVYEEEEREYKRKAENVKNCRRWSSAPQSEQFDGHDVQSRHYRSMSVSVASATSLCSRNDKGHVSAQEAQHQASMHHGMPPSPSSVDF